MKKFKDALEVSYEKKKNPWSFDCPNYDQRSSCFIEAGTNYGVGKRTPVGKEKASSESAVPYGRIDTMKVGYVHRGKVDEFESPEE